MTYPFPDGLNVDPPIVVTGTTGADAKDLANDAWEGLRQGIDKVATDAALLNIIYLGAGRFVQTDVTVGQPIAGTGLTIRQPNAVLLVHGRYYEVDNPAPDEYVVIADILPNKSSGVEVFAGLEDELLVTKPEWQFDTFPTLEADLETIAGLVHLGTAITDSSGVTDFTPSTLDGRGVIRPRGTGSSSGEGGGDGGITQEQLDAAIAALKALLEAEIAALRAQIVSGTRPVQQPLDKIVHEQQIQRGAIARLEVEVFDRADVIERSQSATIGKGFGSGESSGPDYDGAGDLGKDADGKFGV